jgi:hypothetical protein
MRHEVLRGRRVDGDADVIARPGWPEIDRQANPSSRSSTVERAGMPAEQLGAIVLAP